MKKIQIVTLNACNVQSCILETDAAKRGSDAQNTTSGSMNTACLAKHIFNNLSIKFFSRNTVINFFYCPGIWME